MTRSPPINFPHEGAPGSAWVEDIASAFDAADLFFGHGTDNARDEATWLVAAVAGLDYANADWPAALEQLLVDPLPGPVQTEVVTIAQRRIHEKIPLAYLLNQAWFCGRAYYVDERVLVPRSPIASLIDARFTPWANSKDITRVLDLCTGSGCIGIATAFALPWARVDATDLSADALAVAQQNVQTHEVADRVELYQGDLFDALAEDSRYDLIVTNPPYVDASEMYARPAEFCAEPEIGLAAGDDGLDIARRILAGAARFLRPGGILVLEVGASDDALQAAFPTVPFTWWLSDDWGYGVLIMDREALVAHAESFGAQ